MPRFQRVGAQFIVFVAFEVSQYAADVSTQSSPDPSVMPFQSVDAGSVSAGCVLCRDSGNCSIAMNNTSSGVFCGDLLYSTDTQPCCCPYFIDCRVTSKSSSCDCGFTMRHERLSAAESPFESTQEVFENKNPELNDPVIEEMSISTEILIHISAYLAFFVFAIEDVNLKLLRLRQRFSMQRCNPQSSTGTGDDLPLLESESSATIPK
ncbi:uncharacterized protein PHALS_13400 [Plasmopara halstedii]|uniref:Uncharacterized protein n=1 Tax=Plasmopara halstedii TaxID=4781 RepID=A0A0P1APE7_PLAHL|nr:uncharacterized protein PHALS_13400 [Plasmopara halstedii]CEG43186.1 hypothetical protein PHALS_13400 [Plasmopara halstedii]|eukprot:XP_024579555.1 hypothetical protein PHALS_13400 [Plasmopara halstedii]